MRTVKALILMFGMTVAGSAAAMIVPGKQIGESVPLNQVSDPPDRVATARVTDLHGKVIGAVQKVELRDGKPTHLDIALLSSGNTVTLDAACVRYDAGANVVAVTESAGQLMARPQT
jgi:hypothetical protein